ncbi:MAG: primosomal protein N' [Lachnospiraceae bacterium]|nr:primosomal protein N' [Lachnospiraceae bacterium]
MRYADVIVDISLEKLDKTYQYAIPEHLSETAVVGAKVEVPFGGGNRKLEGYIMDTSDTPVFDPARTKEILSVVQGAVSLERRSITLAYWMKEHFGGTMNEALKTVLPVKQEVRNLKKRTIVLTAEGEEFDSYYALAVKRKYEARIRLLDALKEKKELDYTEAEQGLRLTASTVDAVCRDGIVSVREETVYRNPAKGIQATEKPLLNEEQKTVVETVWSEYSAGKRGTYLLFGVTGSGKTEVYLELIERVIREGKQAIMLIPEISLTFQTVRRFYERFGERVSVLHSRLSAGERYDQYVRARKGEIDVMIGPRSALFSPFERLGLILIDEEQEGAYKSEGTPKYHAREMAEYLAELTGASLVLGSATPSLEAYTKAKNGTYKLLTLTKRAKEAVMPKVEVVDLRQELAEGNRSMFSRKLKEQMQERLVKGEQIMLFLNRRGYAGAVSCRACGEGMKCPHCDISLTFHKGGKLLCHYCGYETVQPKTCPSCGSKYIGLFGTGTQKVEEAVLREFPGTSVLRMDADTTKNKGGHEKIVEAFAKGEAQVLIGTQMIVKGHDFPKVTLVGIIAADLSLYAGDYRAAERTFCLLAQAAGRAGRDKLPGDVVIQTYQPEHYSIVAAATEDYEGFYEQEMAYRRLLRYPPAAHVLAILIQGEEEAVAKAAAVRIADVLQRAKKPEEGFGTISGPVPAGLAKANDMYRFIIYVKSPSYERLMEFHRLSAEEKLLTESSMKCNIQFDFNPLSGY